MILGHLSAAAIAKKIFFPMQAMFLLTAASYAPDLLDKPVAQLTNCQGRAYGHTLSALVIFAVLGLFLAGLGKIEKKTVLAATLLWLSHLACDSMTAYPEILFWPLLGPMPELPAVSMLESIRNLYVDMKMPFTLAAEIVMAVAALYLWRPRKKNL